MADHLHFELCPFCGGPARISQSILNDDHHFSVVCVDCGARRGDFNDTDSAEYAWNHRYFSKDQIEAILSSEGRKVQQDKPYFPKISLIFFWLTCFVFSFASYLDDSSHLADSLNVLGVFTLIFSIFSFGFWVDSIGNSKDLSAE